MPILCRQTSLPAQLSHYQSTEPTTVLESGQECQSPEQTIAGSITSELSGSALTAAMSGRVKLHSVRGKTADFLDVATKLLEGEKSTPHLKQHSISCCMNGTMSAMLQMAFIPAPPPLAAKSWCIGCATTAPRDSCTGINCVLLIGAGKRTTGCPYCAGHQVCKCNSLQTHYPMIASEWNSAKNDLTPAQVTSTSDQVVWWQNCVRGSWAQKINQRTNPRVNPR